MENDLAAGAVGFAERVRGRRLFKREGNASQQLGSALGLAILSAIATSRTQSLLTAHAPQLVALTSGYHRGLLVGSVFMAAAAVIALRTSNTTTAASPPPGPAAEAIAETPAARSAAAQPSRAPRVMGDRDGPRSAGPGGGPQPERGRHVPRPGRRVAVQPGQQHLDRGLSLPLGVPVDRGDRWVALAGVHAVHARGDQ